MTKGVQIAIGATAIAGLLGWYGATTLEAAPAFTYFKSLEEFQANPKPKAAPARASTATSAKDSIHATSKPWRCGSWCRTTPPHLGRGSGRSGSTLAVTFTSLETPDLFKDGAEVVARGAAGGGPQADAARIPRRQAARQVPLEVRGHGRGPAHPQLGPGVRQRAERPPPTASRAPNTGRNSHGLRSAALSRTPGVADGGYSASAVPIYAGRSGRRADWTRVAERSVWRGLRTGELGDDRRCSYSVRAASTMEILPTWLRHSARSMALHYRLAALWGGQAGSLLLWLWMLMRLLRRLRLRPPRTANRSLMPWVVAVLQANATLLPGAARCFVTRSLRGAAARPRRSRTGTGLNPLLQHPVMMIHPLMLYTGLVGFVVPFAFAFAALVTGELGGPSGSAPRAAGRSFPGSSSRSGSCSAGAGPTRCWAGEATGRGTRSRTPPSCPGCPLPPICTR